MNLNDQFTHVDVLADMLNISPSWCHRKLREGGLTPYGDFFKTEDFLREYPRINKSGRSRGRGPAPAPRPKMASSAKDLVQSLMSS